MALPAPGARGAPLEHGQGTTAGAGVVPPAPLCFPGHPTGKDPQPKRAPQLPAPAPARGDGDPPGLCCAASIPPTGLLGQDAQTSSRGCAPCSCACCCLLVCVGPQVAPPKLQSFPLRPWQRAVQAVCPAWRCLGQRDAVCPEIWCRCHLISRWPGTWSTHGEGSEEDSIASHPAWGGAEGQKALVAAKPSSSSSRQRAPGAPVALGTSRLCGGRQRKSPLSLVEQRWRSRQSCHGDFLPSRCSGQVQEEALPPSLCGTMPAGACRNRKPPQPPAWQPDGHRHPPRAGGGSVPLTASAGETESRSCSQGLSLPALAMTTRSAQTAGPRGAGVVPGGRGAGHPNRARPRCRCSPGARSSPSLCPPAVHCTAASPHIKTIRLFL